MASSVETIIAELKRVFPATREDGAFPLIGENRWRDPEIYDVEKAFCDKRDWTVLDAKWLDRVPKGLSSALSFLSDEAICFFIPAFIMADLEGQLDSADPKFHLTHGLGFSRDIPTKPGRSETWTDYAKRRWSHLTSDQALAIAHYLEWVSAQEESYTASQAAEALKFYWYERAAG